MMRHARELVRAMLLPHFQQRLVRIRLVHELHHTVLVGQLEEPRAPKAGIPLPRLGRGQGPLCGRGRNVGPLVPAHTLRRPDQVHRPGLTLWLQQLGPQRKTRQESREPVNRGREIKQDNAIVEPAAHFGRQTRSRTLAQAIRATERAYGARHVHDQGLAVAHQALPACILHAHDADAGRGRLALEGLDPACGRLVKVARRAQKHTAHVALDIDVVVDKLEPVARHDIKRPQRAQQDARVDIHPMHARQGHLVQHLRACAHILDLEQALCGREQAAHGHVGMRDRVQGKVAEPHAAASIRNRDGERREKGGSHGNNVLGLAHGRREVIRHRLDANRPCVAEPQHARPDPDLHNLH